MSSSDVHLHSPAATLRERLLISSHATALALIDPNRSSQYANRCRDMAQFERSLAILASQPPEEAALTAVNLCSAAMSAQMLWPIRCLTRADSPLTLTDDDRAFLLQSHLRFAPVAPRSRAQSAVASPASDPTVLWCHLAFVLLEEPFPACPQRLLADIGAVAELFANQGTDWMDPISFKKYPSDTPDAQTQAERALLAFNRLKALCEERQIQHAVRPINAKSVKKPI